jgi:hypothetical protein
MLVAVSIYEKEFDIKTRAAVDLLVFLFLDYGKIVETDFITIEIYCELPVFIDAVGCVGSVKNTETVE